MKKEIKRLEKQIEDMKEQWAKEREALIANSGSSSQKMEELMEKMKKDHQKQIEDLNKDRSDEIEKLKAKHAKEMEELRASLLNEKENAISELMNGHLSEMKAVSAKHESLLT